MSPTIVPNGVIVKRTLAICRRRHINNLSILRQFSVELGICSLMVFARATSCSPSRCAVAWISRGCGTFLELSVASGRAPHQLKLAPPPGESHN